MPPVNVSLINKASSVYIDPCFFCWTVGPAIMLKLCNGTNCCKTCALKLHEELTTVLYAVFSNEGSSEQ